MARSTPAQNPRGAHSVIWSFGLVMPRQMLS
jgi:hypothetical protein